jgi:hypothetical protein
VLGNVRPKQAEHTGQTVGNAARFWPIASDRGGGNVSVCDGAGFHTSSIASSTAILSDTSIKRRSLAIDSIRAFAWTIGRPASPSTEIAKILRIAWIDTVISLYAIILIPLLFWPVWLAGG